MTQFALLACFAFLCGCGHGGGNKDAEDSLDDDGGECKENADCTDGVNCTQDTCQAGHCIHVPLHSLCAAHEYCDTEGGCVGSIPCAVEGDCFKEDPCTVGSCNDSTGMCVLDRLDDDGDGDPPVICGGTDCDDDRSSIHGGAREECDGADNDCDGGVDEDFECSLDSSGECDICGETGTRRCGGTCVWAPCMPSSGSSLECAAGVHRPCQTECMTPGSEACDDTCLWSDTCIPLEGECGPYEATFIVSQIRVGTVDQGFNIDGIDTWCSDGTCIIDGNLGVDNRLDPIFTSIENASGESLDVDGRMARSIQQGEMLVLLRLLDIIISQMASPEGRDDSVRAMSYLGIDTDDPVDPSDNLTGHEPFDVDSASLEDPGTDVDSPLSRFEQCGIQSGIFQCEPSLSPIILALHMDGSILDLDLQHAQISALVDVSPVGDGSGNYVDGSMSQGVLGGYVPIEDLKDALVLFVSPFADLSPTTIEQILISHADIDAMPEGMTGVPCPTGNECQIWQDCRSGMCHEPAGVNDAVSVAVTFSLASAIFTGNV